MEGDIDGAGSEYQRWQQGRQSPQGFAPWGQGTLGLLMLGGGVRTRSCIVSQAQGLRLESSSMYELMIEGNEVRHGSMPAGGLAPGKGCV